MTQDRYIGLISGTSMDGIDAAAVDFSGDRPEILGAQTVPYTDSLRAQLDELRADPDAFPATRLARLDTQVGEAFVIAANELLAATGLRPGDVRAIGSHGQTVLHRPDDDPPHTLQIGDPTRIAAATGIDVVADFRRADLAVGGQGAPLAPLLHAALLGTPSETRIVVNLGGIANATVLDGGRVVAGFDTGPANCFLDDWYRAHHDGRFDAGGAWAASGRVDERLLERLTADDYFSKPPPRSTGIEYFGPRWLRERLPDDADTRAADIQATLAEFSAATLVDAIRRFGPAPDRILLCGGGVANADLVARIRRRLGETPVHSTAEHGIDPDFVEATLFAWLAREFLAGRAVDTPPVTGAAHPVRLGALWPAG